MLTDNQLRNLQNELIDIYSKLEIELIISVAKRLNTYDTVDGTLEWQLRKLSEMNVLNKDLLSLISKYSNKTQKAIEDMLKQAMLANLDREYLNQAFKEGLTTIDYTSLTNSPIFKRVLESSVYELSEHLSFINTKALESAKQSYIKTINRAYVEAETGVFSLNEAVARGIKEMAKKGFKGATYESGRSIGIEAAVRRDTLSAIISNVNKNAIESAKKLNTNYVEVSKHLGARVSTNKIANHAGWQGKVYQIEGSSDKYGNLVEETGYGTIEGLGGVNCRHRVYPFFPGLSVEKTTSINQEENEEVYNATQRLRALEREFRANKREWYATKETGDKATKKKCENKAKDILNKIKQIENEYPDIGSNSSRTLVLEDLR